MKKEKGAEKRLILSKPVRTFGKNGKVEGAAAESVSHRS